VLRQNCWEHELSPDGNYLACVDQATTVKVIETKTGKKVWEKKQFYPLSEFEYIIWLTHSSRESDIRFQLFQDRFLNGLEIRVDEPVESSIVSSSRSTVSRGPNPKIPRWRSISRR
jgi:hypothetical protein